MAVAPEACSLSSSFVECRFFWFCQTGQAEVMRQVSHKRENFVLSVFIENEAPILSNTLDYKYLLQFILIYTTRNENA